MATTSAARCASRPIATAWSACVSALPALLPSTRPSPRTAGRSAARSWLELRKPVDLQTYIAAHTEREGLLFRWMSFLLQWPLVIFPTLADLPPKQVGDTTVEGQAEIFDSMAPAFAAPLLGLPGLAV